MIPLHLDTPFTAALFTLLRRTEEKMELRRPVPLWIAGGLAVLSFLWR